MRAAVSTMLLLGLSTFLDAAPPPPAGRATAVGAGFPAMEKFIINAQYRGVATKSFKNLGKGTVRYQHTGAGQFGLGIISSLSNPENGEKYRLNVEGRFRIRGRAIERIEQRLDLNEQARRYENLVTHNLPFVYIARFYPLPKGSEPEENLYQYDGRDYMLRYVTVEDAVEATLFESGTMIGKFFLHGEFGKPPRGLQKARMVSGTSNIVFSLVIDRSEEATSGRGKGE